MRNKIKAGFTTLELLLAVAVMTILMAVVSVNVVKYQRTLKYRELNEIAKQIYLAAQDHLTMAGAQNLLGDMDGGAYSVLSLSTRGGIPANLGTEATNAAGTALAGQYLVFNDTAATAVPMKYLLPSGAVDETFRHNNYIIRYNAETYRVLDVFYSEKVDVKGEWSGLTNGVYSDDDLTSPKDEDAVRDALINYNGGIVGWYAGESLAPAAPEAGGKPGLKIINDDVLYAIVTVDKKTEYNGDTVTLILSQSGKTPITIDIPLSGAVPGRVFRQTEDLTVDYMEYHILLDDVTASGMQFKDFGSDFDLGADFSAVVTGQLKTAASKSVQSRERTGNPLFADGSTDTDVHIENFRHMQNLGTAFSGFAGKSGSTTTAYLDNSITWTNGFTSSVATLKNAAFGMAVNIADIMYAPVDPGYAIEFEGQKNTIKDLEARNKTGPNNYAGLFGEVTKDFSVKDLTMSAPKITGLYVGAVAARVSDVTSVISVSLSNIKVTGSGTGNGTYDVQMPSNASGGDAGGLIGLVDARGGGATVTLNGITTENLAVYARGDSSAAGLIGELLNIDTLTGSNITVNGGSVDGPNRRPSGGLFGSIYRRGGGVTNEIVLSGITIEGGSVDTSSTEYAGGVVGFIASSVRSLRIGSDGASAASPDIKITGQTVKGKDCAGGVVGSSNANNTIKGVSLTNTTTVCDNTSGYAGGVAAHLQGPFSIKEVSADRITVTGGRDASIGGIAGYLTGANSNETMKNITVSRSTIKNTEGAESVANAGGIVGLDNRKSSYTGITVSDTTVRGNQAGGVVGQAADAVTIKGADEPGAVVFNTSVEGGSYAGGLLGKAEGAVEIEGVSVHHTTGGSYDEAQAMVKATGTDGTAGGLIGLAQGAVTMSGSQASVLVRGGTNGTGGGLVGSATGGGKIEKCYVGGHTFEGAYPGDGNAAHTVPNVTGGTSGSFIGGVSGGTITLKTCYSTANSASEKFIGSGSVTYGDDKSFDGTGSEANTYAVNKTDNGLHQAKDFFFKDEVDRTAAGSNAVDGDPYDQYLASDGSLKFPFPFYVKNDSYDFMKNHIGDWNPNIAVTNYYTVRWNLANGANGKQFPMIDESQFAKGNSSALSDGSTNQRTDAKIEEGAPAKEPPDLSQYAGSNPEYLDHTVDYWAWYNEGNPDDGQFRLIPEKGHSLFDALTNWGVKLYEWLGSKWGNGQNLTETDAEDNAYSTPMKVTGDITLYAHAIKDPSVVELRGYKHDDPNTPTSGGKIPDFIEYPDSVDVKYEPDSSGTDPSNPFKPTNPNDPDDTPTHKQVTFTTPNLGGYEPRMTDTNSDGKLDPETITWFYHDDEKDIDVIIVPNDPKDPSKGYTGYEYDPETGTIGAPTGDPVSVKPPRDPDDPGYDPTDPNNDKWEIIIPNSASYIYTNYDKITERYVYVSFMSNGMRLREDTYMYTYSNFETTKTLVKLPNHIEMANYSPVEINIGMNSEKNLTQMEIQERSSNSMYGKIVASDGTTEWHRKTAEQTHDYGDPYVWIYSYVGDETNKYYIVEYEEIEALRTEVHHVFNNVDNTYVTDDGLTNTVHDLNSYAVNAWTTKVNVTNWIHGNELPYGTGTATAVETYVRGSDTQYLERNLASLMADDGSTGDDAEQQTYKDDFALSVPGYTAQTASVTTGTYTDNDDKEQTKYIVTIKYTRKNTTLYYDLNNGVRSYQEGNYTYQETNMTPVSKGAGTPSGTYDKAHTETNNSAIARSGYTPVGWYMVSRAEYENAKSMNTDADDEDFDKMRFVIDYGVNMNNYRSTVGKYTVYNYHDDDGDKTLFAYNDDEDLPMPTSDQYAILIWQQTSNKGDVEVRLYVQQRTDEVGTPDAAKSYYLFRTMSFYNLDVGSYYDEHKNDFYRQIINKNEDRNSSENLISGDLHYILGEEYLRNGSGSRSNVYFKLNRANSDVTKKVEPGEGNVINLYYDRATIVFKINTAIPESAHKMSNNYFTYKGQGLTNVTKEQWFTPQVQTTTNYSWDTSDYRESGIQGITTESWLANKAKSLTAWGDTYYSTGRTGTRKKKTYDEFKYSSPYGSYWDEVYWFKRNTTTTTELTGWTKYDGTVSTRYATTKWQDQTITQEGITYKAAGFRSINSDTTENNRYLFTYTTKDIADVYLPYTGAWDAETIQWQNGKLGFVQNGTWYQLFGGEAGEEITNTKYEWRPEEQAVYRKGSTSGKTEFMGLYEADWNDYPSGKILTVSNHNANPPVLSYFSYEVYNEYFTLTNGRFVMSFTRNNPDNDYRTRTFYKERDETDVAPTSADGTNNDGVISNRNPPTVKSNKTLSTMQRYFQPGVLTYRRNGNSTAADSRFAGYDSFAYISGDDNTAAKTYSDSVSYTNGYDQHFFYSRHPYEVSFLDASVANGKPSTLLNPQTVLYMAPVSVPNTTNNSDLPGKNDIMFTVRDPDYSFGGWSLDGKTPVTDTDGNFLTAYKTLKYGNAQASGETHYFGMPATNLQFIAIWSAPVTVQFQMNDGTYNASHTLTTPVQKYEKLSNLQLNEVDQWLHADVEGKEVTWYRDEAHTNKFDLNNDPITGTSTSGEGRVLKLYGVASEAGTAVVIPIRYRFDGTSQDSTTTVPAHYLKGPDTPEYNYYDETVVPTDAQKTYRTVDAAIDTEYTVEAPTIISMMEKDAEGRDVERIYQLRLDESDTRSGVTTRQVVEEGIEFTYELYTGKKWRFDVVTYLQVGNGDEAVILRIDTKQVEATGQTALFIPKDEVGLKLARSYATVEIDRDEKPQNVSDADWEQMKDKKEIGILYIADQQSIRFTGDIWNSEKNKRTDGAFPWPEVFTYNSANSTQKRLPLYLYLEGIYDETARAEYHWARYQEVNDGTGLKYKVNGNTAVFYKLGADYTYKKGDADVYTRSDWFEIEKVGDELKEKVHKIAENYEVPDTAATASDYWVKTDPPEGQTTADVPWKEGTGSNVTWNIKAMRPGNYKGTAVIWVQPEDNVGVNETGKVKLTTKDLTNTLTVN